jgi:hypothetical protein
MRVWTLLLLAAIGLQAAEPIHAPLQRTQGSAFSATTIDVAVVSNRKGETEVLASPLPAPAMAAVQPRLKSIPLTAIAPAHLWPETRGPPPRGHPAAPPDSTAPPFA